MFFGKLDSSLRRWREDVSGKNLPMNRSGKELDTDGISHN
jgi:hypothetical protein